MSSRFPEQLHDFLTHNPLARDIIEWSSSGDYFTIRDQDLLADRVLDLFAARGSSSSNKVQYKSFVKKLTRWGFKLMLPRGSSPRYRNKLFRRDNFDLCKGMKCEKVRCCRNWKAHNENRRQKWEQTKAVANAERRQKYDRDKRRERYLRRKAREAEAGGGTTGEAAAGGGTAIRDDITGAVQTHWCQSHGRPSSSYEPLPSEITTDGSASLGNHPVNSQGYGSPPTPLAASHGDVGLDPPGDPSYISSDHSSLSLSRIGSMESFDVDDTDDLDIDINYDDDSHDHTLLLV